MLLEVKDLCLNIDKKQILSSVSFCVEKGDFAVLCGRNGAGKSQLLKIIKGLRKQSSGSIFISGQDLSRDRGERMKRIALVFQNADLQAVGETVEKDVAFGPENLGWDIKRIKERTDQVISLLGLEEKRHQRPATLSGGEKRKLAIAGTLAMDPDIILLDEPFVALDYPSVRTVLSSLVSLHRKGHTILIVSHEIEKFLAHATRLLILKEGKITCQGRPEDCLDELREAEVYLPDLPFKELTWLTT